MINCSAKIRGTLDIIQENGKNVAFLQLVAIVSVSMSQICKFMISSLPVSKFSRRFYS